MRAKHTALILTAGFLLIPTLTWSQGPGGGRPGGGNWGGDRGGFGGGQPAGQWGGAQWGGNQGGDRGAGGDRGFGGAPGGGPGMGTGGGGRMRMMADPDQFFDQYSKDGKVLRREDRPQQLQM